MAPEDVNEAKIELEREQLKLERERLELERRRLERGESFFNRHFGAIATGIVSLAVAIFSVVQFLAAEANDRREAVRAAEQREQELELQELQQERDWKMTIVSFVTEHRSEIFSESEQDRQHMQKVMLVAFPPEITSGFFEQAARTAPAAQREEWQRQHEAARDMIPVTVYIHIVREDQREVARRAAGRLEERGFSVPGIEHLDIQRTSSVIRYFDAGGREEAARISGALGDAECTVTPEDASGWSGARNARPRTYEIWYGSDCL